MQTYRALASSNTSSIQRCTLARALECTLSYFWHSIAVLKVVPLEQVVEKSVKATLDDKVYVDARLGLDFRKGRRKFNDLAACCCLLNTEELSLVVILVYTNN